MELRPVSSLVFKVHRRSPELISPAKPTPREMKILSDVDDQLGLRNRLCAILFYRSMVNGKNNNNTDPVKVIRKALADTLVHYYPFAGRLWEGPNRKLMVDCNGEGVLFIEGDAEVTLDEFEDVIHPPFRCFEELLSDVEGSRGIVNSPLLHIQVTRLKCGGFIVALRFIHVICDGVGLCQFLKTLGELARGATVPSTPPIWERHLLNARVPARITHVHREYDKVQRSDVQDIVPCGRSVQRSFFFGPKEISALYRLLPADLQDHSTSFELVASFLWRCWTIAMRSHPSAETRLMITINARPLLHSPPLPPGYYGNAIFLPVAIANVKELYEQPLEFVLRLIQEAKGTVTEEYVRSAVDLLATRGRRHVMINNTYLVSDVRRLGFDDVDFGWGPPVYGGPAEGRMGVFEGVSFLVSCKNDKGETGFIVPIILPEPAMERFVEELARVFNNGASTNKPFKSSL